MMPKKHTCALVCAIVILSACAKQQQPAEKRQFTDELRLGITPVKDQGKSSTCWIYAMLATIETNHIEMGDSVNLSAKYLQRRLLEETHDQIYMTQGQQKASTRGMASDCLDMMEQYGLTHFNAYSDNEKVQLNILYNKVKQLAERGGRSKAGLKRLHDNLKQLLDKALGPVPRHVFMLGAVYTPREFAHSVCTEGEYEAITSFTHHPFNEPFALEVPDNSRHHQFLNLPLDTMMARLDSALNRREAVCWEGDISEPLFSFANGTADMTTSSATQEERQRQFERFQTTDDHCMAIIGRAHDRKGRRYYIMKNSWGSNNPYGGLMYVSEQYVRMKTVALFLRKK